MGPIPVCLRVLVSRLARVAPDGAASRAASRFFEELMEHGYTWEIYFDDHPQSFALRNLHPYAADLFCRMEIFGQDVQNATLPNYSFLEPQYFSALGNLRTMSTPHI